MRMPIHVMAPNERIGKLPEEAMSDQLKRGKLEHAATGLAGAWLLNQLAGEQVTQAPLPLRQGGQFRRLASFFTLGELWH
jgi:hypothetical protein